MGTNDLRRQLYQARALLVSQRRLVLVGGGIEVEEEQDSELRRYAIRLEEELAKVSDNPMRGGGGIHDRDGVAVMGVCECELMDPRMGKRGREVMVMKHTSTN